MPEAAKGVLAAHIPDLEVEVWEIDQGDILSNGGDSLEVWVEMWGVLCFDLLEESGLAGGIEA